MPGGALGRGAALRHVQGVDAVIGVLTGRVHSHTSHVVEGRVEWQSRTHPEVHVRAQIVS